ncbi:hypothetical protein RHSIM_Rhsim04G0018100 [Rhododendron simsii]|uniref:Uncharacterized protein n=1 Tax=Rhododendron simsii TaxID=118357 RepID=A0A834H257_RHOSS|nr:hypothetical protein RHSIM_Rhsim04G0018100 [Rhododendron simsii]
MAAWTAAARQASNLSRLSSPKSLVSGSQAANLIQLRGLAGGGDHHGPPKVNFWEDPLSPSKWKEEHFVIVSLAGWGALFYGGYKFFTKGKKEDKEEGDDQLIQVAETFKTDCSLMISCSHLLKLEKDQSRVSVSSEESELPPLSGLELFHSFSFLKYNCRVAVLRAPPAVVSCCSQRYLHFEETAMHLPASKACLTGTLDIVLYDTSGAKLNQNKE